MIIFKIIFIILLAAPVIGVAALVYSKARAYAIKQNKAEMEKRKYSGFMDR